MSWFDNYCDNVKRRFKENTWMTQQVQTSEWTSNASDQSAGYTYLIGGVAACIQALFD